MDRNNMSHFSMREESGGWVATGFGFRAKRSRSSYVSSGPRSLPPLGKRHPNGHGARLSPPAQPSQQDDIINYIYDSWNKVTRDLERGGDDARYYQEAAPRQLAQFRPFDLDEWWGRRLLQAISRNKHRS